MPFMTTYTQFVLEDDGLKVLGLPYLQGEYKRRFTMYVFLPDAKDGLKSLIEKIGSKYDFFDRHVPLQNIEIGQLLIPNFKSHSALRLLTCFKHSS